MKGLLNARTLTDSENRFSSEVSAVIRDSEPENVTAASPLHSGNDIGALRRVLRGCGAKFYVYVLRRVDGTAFYVGKGQRFRALHHEAEARTAGRLTHKLNTIRKVLREGELLIYEIDSVHDQEAAAHLRERFLIQKFGRHDLGLGPLTNQTDGGEGTSNPSEESRQRRRESLWGELAEDDERRLANKYFQRLISVRSVPIKPASSFVTRPLRANRKTFPFSTRQAAALLASAIANRVLLRPGSIIPRRLETDGVAFVIENGVGCDILSSGLATLTHDAHGAEAFVIDLRGLKYLVDTIGEAFLLDAGILLPG